MTAEHPCEPVALLRGPLVLFGVGQNLPAPTRAQLLAAGNTYVTSKESRVHGTAGNFPLLPFVDLTDKEYVTYFKLA